jgi:hypothetical protein
MEEQTIKFLNRAFILAAILVVGVLIFFVGQIAYQTRLIDQQNTNQITVSGQGKIYAKPDVAVVSLGVTSQATTVADVTKNNTDKMNAVIEAIKALNIDEKDIQTTNYNLTPVYEKTFINTPVNDISINNSVVVSSGNSTVTRTETALKGYKLEQNIQIKIRDFTKIGDVLSQGTAKGANLVGDLRFTIDDPAQFKEQARAKAIEQAKVNAKNLAKESGINLGKIINIYENSYNYSIDTFSSAKAMGAGISESVPAPTIEPGQQEINVTINLTYKIK